MHYKTLDHQFSRIVRARADWTCANCGKCFEDRPEELHCSHFHSRVHHNVRFDFENCDALCWECHDYFTHHPSEYSGWKLSRMGEEAFEALRIRAQKVVHVDPKLVRANIRLIHAA